MTLVGTPEDWIDLIESFVPDILRLVISTWQDMPVPQPNALEDPTTEALYRRLQQNRTASELPFQIHIQMAELDPAAGEDQGRMDIAFLPLVPREDIYFCLECKRLNVTDGRGEIRSYTSEYLTHGMLRFIRGQYARRVRHGGMLAYVLDGNVAKAIENVGRLTKRRYKDLSMNAPGNLLPSSIWPQEDKLKETHHSRRHGLAYFQIHHIFASGMSSG